MDEYKYRGIRCKFHPGKVHSLFVSILQSFSAYILRTHHQIQLNFKG